MKAWTERRPRRNSDLDAINARWHECREFRCAAWAVLWLVTFGVAVGVLR